MERLTKINGKYQVGLEWYKTTCDFDCINKTVFLTQAEAEQKLKEMESE